MPQPAEGAAAPEPPSRGRHRAPAPPRRRHAATAPAGGRSVLAAVGAGVVAAVVLGSAGWAAAATTVAQVGAVGRYVTGADTGTAIAPAPGGSGDVVTALAPAVAGADDLPDKSLLAAARVAPVAVRGAVVAARPHLRTAAVVPRRKPLPGWEVGQTPPREVVRANVSVLAAVRRYFPASQVGNAMAVADCESSQQWWQRGPVNRNGTRDWGLFQFNDGGTLQGTLTAIGVRYSSLRQAQALALDPDINARMAIHLYRDRGWSPWVCAYTQGIVAALWSNRPGPMAGRYDVGGDPLPLTPPASPAPVPTAPRRPAPRPTPSPSTPRRPAPSPSVPTIPPSTPPPSAPSGTPAPTDPTPVPGSTPPPGTPSAEGSVVGAAPAGS